MTESPRGDRLQIGHRIIQPRVWNCLKLRRKQGMSIERSNHDVRAIKSFTRWMEPKRIAADPLQELKIQDPGEDRRLVRRALPPP